MQPRTEVAGQGWLGICLLAMCLSIPPCRAAENEQAKPNLILILCDDLGYGDLGCYGNKVIRTPNLDRLAGQGVRFTDFYCAGAQCTPSRAGMLTGRYPVRFGLTFSLMADAGYGIPDSEVLLPAVLRKAGYATMLAGKWHLGDQPKFHPLRHGFEHFAGLLRGHDTEPREFWRDDRIVERSAAVETLTARYTDAAVEFIAARAKERRPFFLMLAHTAPHVPLAAGAKFAGKSAAGAYGDCVEEIDDSVGQVVAAVRAGGIEENTLIFFSSDNGAAVDQGKNGGSTGPLRAGKYSTFEGGVRVPAIFWGPGRIKPKVETRPAILLDVFPTFLSMAEAKMPAGVVIDGKDLSGVLAGNGRREGEEFFFYFKDELQACRSGDWKLKLEEKPGEAAMLFDLSHDPSEAHDLAREHPEVVERLRRRMREFEQSVRR
jgi:arylsulfatase A